MFRRTILCVFIVCSSSAIAQASNQTQQGGSVETRYQQLIALAKKIETIRTEKQYDKLYELACQDEKQRLTKDRVVNGFTMLDKAAGVLRLEFLEDRMPSADQGDALKKFEAMDTAEISFRVHGQMDIGGEMEDVTSIQVWTVHYQKDNWCVKFSGL